MVHTINQQPRLARLVYASIVGSLKSSCGRKLTEPIATASRLPRANGAVCEIASVPMQSAAAQLKRMKNDTIGEPRLVTCLRA